MTRPAGAFARLRELLRDIPAPPGLAVIDLQLGESRLGTPAAALANLGTAQGWTSYPPLGGSAELRAAYSGWLARRFGAGPALRAGRVAIEPTPGSKQAVAVAIALAVTRDRGGAEPAAARDRGGAEPAVALDRGGAEPAVVLPNPGYPAYRAGTEAAGARAIHYPPTEGGAASAVRAAVRAAGGRVAAIVVCNPGNPRGEILAPETLRELGGIAAAARAVLLVDECYTDVTCGRRPPGYLSVLGPDPAGPDPAGPDPAGPDPAGPDPAGPDPAGAGPAGPGRFLVLHSLSKRSGVPGLRSGFLAGDPASVAAYAHYNRACGVSSPRPVCAVAAALWSDDLHVTRLQAALRRNWELADELLADVPGYRRAEAGFFLWLPVPDDEAAARRLWQRHGLRVMPGRYLSVPDRDGVDPGVGHLRIALVHDEELMREALTRLRHAARQVEQVTA